VGSAEDVATTTRARPTLGEGVCDLTLRREDRIKIVGVLVGVAGLLASAVAVSASPVPSPAQSSALLNAMWEVWADLPTPVEAPRWLPKPPSRLHPYLGVSTRFLHGSVYEVNLQWTATPLSVDSPMLAEPPNTGLAEFLGSFGGAAYASGREARAALRRDNSYASSPPRGASARVVLGVRIVGRGWPAAGVVVWRQGGWLCQVEGIYDLPLARALAVALRRSPLAARTGVLAVDNAGDGEHSAIDWVNGRMVYQVIDYHSARAALAIARSMAPFPAPHMPASGPPLAQEIATVQSFNRLNPWIRLLSPRQGQLVWAGERLAVRGTVRARVAPGTRVAWTLLAGSLKPSRAVGQGTFTVGTSGTVTGFVQLPHPLPTLHGPAMTVTLQLVVRMGPISQVLVVPGPPPR
jgi:hypothetical protein